MFTRMVRTVLGPARDPSDPNIYHKISLIAFLAWVGIGADGLSSSCYGPEESFKALGGHASMALFLALATAVTIGILSAGYAYVIEAFPSGGGGYVVASKTLGSGPGLVAGSALLIDYVLTIAVSIVSGVDAIFSFLPLEWNGIPLHTYKVPAAGLAILMLMVLNLRGVKESILALLPVFVIFIITHIVAILAGVFGHAEGLGTVVRSATQDVTQSVSTIGLGATLLIFLQAYSMGAGTYTGIEAVSNSMQILREPKVATGKRTMMYMAFSLSFVSGGIILAYLLFNVQLENGKTLNAVLFERIAGGWGGAGRAFVLVTLVSEAALLFVAAQAGFIDGPRILATMAVDHWMPQRFSRLSDRLVTQDGVLIMGLSAILFLLATKGQIHALIVLYSINVFVTFVLSQLGMMRHGWRTRTPTVPWRRRFAVNASAFLLSLVILGIMLSMKLMEGAWLTVVVTTGLCLVAWLIRRHYRGVAGTLKDLDRLVDQDPLGGAPSRPVPPLDPKAPTAVLLVSGYNGIGMHSLLSVIRLFPGYFKNWVFVMVGVIDYDQFKGADEVANLKRRVTDQLSQYVGYMHRLGYPAEAYGTVGLDPVDELMKLCPGIAQQHPRAVFFGGQLIFPEENLFTPILHSGAVYDIQRRLQFSGLPMMVLPIRVRKQPASGNEGSPADAGGEDRLSRPGKGETP